MADRKIPKSISPCPIKSAGLEIKLLIGQSKEEIQQILFLLLRDKISELKQVSVKSIKELEGFEIDHRISLICDKISVVYGSNSLLFESVGDYPGWETFFGFIKFVLEGLSKKLTIKEINRLGLRYINFFDSTQKLSAVAEFELKVPSLGPNLSKFLCKSELKTDEGSANISLVEDVSFLVNNLLERGSVIDIDVIDNSGLPQSFDDLLLEQIIKMHDFESRIFFNLLTNEFYDSLNKEFSDDITVLS